MTPTAERLRYYLDFGEDGPWAWWWFRIRVGCWRGHDWEIVTESFPYSHETVGRGRECRRCHAWGGWVE